MRINAFFAAQSQLFNLSTSNTESDSARVAYKIRSRQNILMAAPSHSWKLLYAFQIGYAT